MEANILHNLITYISQLQPQRNDTADHFAPVMDGILTHLPGPHRVIVWGNNKYTGTILASENIQSVVNYGHDEGISANLRATTSSNKFSSKLFPFIANFPVTADVIINNYDPTHPYICDALHEYGEDSFDIALIGGDGYRTDCAEMAQLLVRDGGIIIWQDIVSYYASKPDFPSGRSSHDIFTNFSEYYYFDQHQTLMVVNRKGSPQFGGNQYLQTRFQILKAVFSCFADSDLRYVVLRGAETMQIQHKAGKDVDIIIHPQDMPEAHNILLSAGFSHFRDTSSASGMLYGAQPNDHYLIQQLDLHLDIVQGLYYTSPNRGEKVAVCSHFQESIFTRRQFVGDFWCYTPHPHDLFLHLFCRALYDKRSFSEDYKLLLEDLIQILNHDQLQTELEAIVFNFAPKALETISAQKTEQIPELYFSFSGY